MGDEQDLKISGCNKDILDRVARMEVGSMGLRDSLQIQLDHIKESIKQLQDSIVTKVENHSERLTILQEQMKSTVKEKEFLPLVQSVNELNGIKKWMIGSIAASFFAIIWSLILYGRIK